MQESQRSDWFDETTHEPLIAEQTHRLQSFLDTMADGVVDEQEMSAQEERLIGLMREVEPLLDDTLHEKVTQLLCELTAYDIMQTVYTMQQAKPQTEFQG